MKELERQQETEARLQVRVPAKYKTVTIHMRQSQYMYDSHGIYKTVTARI